MVVSMAIGQKRERKKTHLYDRYYVSYVAIIISKYIYTCIYVAVFLFRYYDIILYMYVDIIHMY